MQKKKPKVPLSSFELCVILGFIAVFSFLAIHPVVGVLVGVLMWLLYDPLSRKFASQQQPPEKYTVSEDTKKLLDTIVSEQTSAANKTFDSFSYPIAKASLPAHVHKILDELGITTWQQLSLFDEKELLYKKCFGQEALEKIKAELSQRGLTLNGPPKS